MESKLLSTRNIGKDLHKLFKYVVNDISQILPILSESGSEVSYFISETRNFKEVNIISEDIKKPWIKATLKKIKIVINNQTFLYQESEKGDSVTPCMDVYKTKIQYNGNIDKLKQRIVFRGYIQNKELAGDTWSPTASMSKLKQ